MPLVNVRCKALNIDLLREDTALSLEFNKKPATDQDEYLRVLYCKLNTFLKAQTPEQRQLAKLLQETVKDINILEAEAYVFGEFHIRRLLQAGKSLPKINEKFYYNCIRLCTSNPTEQLTFDDGWQVSMQQFDALRPAGQVKVEAKPHMGQVISSMRTRMSTAATNSLRANLPKRLTKHLQLTQAEMVPASQRKAVAKAAVELRRIPVHSLKFQLKDTASAAVTPIRELVGDVKIIKGKVTNTTLHHTLPFQMEALRTVEAANQAAEAAGERRKGRTFTLLPMKQGFTISHVPISSMAMLHMMKACKLSKHEGDGRSLSPAEQKSVWALACNIQKFETKSSRFDNSITTDGLAVHLLMDRSTAIEASKTNTLTPEQCVELLYNPMVEKVGVDPGVDQVVTTARLDGSVSAFSSASYYEGAHFNTSRRRIDKWNNEEESREAAEQLAGVTAETADFEQYCAFLRTYLSVLRRLLEHRTARGYRNMRFLRKVGRDQLVNTISRSIAPHKPDGKSQTVVGMGDWRGPGSTPIKRRTCGPLEQVRLHLKHRKDVVLVPIKEPGTSCLCHGCHHRLTNMHANTTRIKRDGERVTKMSKVHKVLHCRASATKAGNNLENSEGSDSCCGTTWNRDVNGAKNMLMLLMCILHGYPRPRAFRLAHAKNG